MNPAVKYPGRHADSYYAASVNQELQFPQLEASVDCDVCVVGAGYTGLTTALNLCQRGYRVVVLEAQRVGWGASGRNGGQLGSGMSWSQRELESEFGIEQARRFWECCEAAKDEVKENIRRYGIECDLKSGVLAAAVTRHAAEQFARNAEHLQTAYDCQSVCYLPSSEMTDRLGTERYFGGTLDLTGGHLHPLNYALGLAQAVAQSGVEIYEHCAAASCTKVDGGIEIKIQSGPRVKAAYAVFACNAYIGRIAPAFSRFIMPVNSYIIATEPLNETVARRINRDDIAVYDSKFCLDYYRLSADRRLLFGGPETYLPFESRNIAIHAKSKVLWLWPELKDIGIDYVWGGKIAVTVNRLPSIGRIAPEIYYAQGFSGHGVALTSLTGKILAEIISGNAERFDLFASIRHRKFPGGRLLHWPIHVLTMTLLDLSDRFSQFRQRVPT